VALARSAGTGLERLSVEPEVPASTVQEASFAPPLAYDRLDPRYIRLQRDVGRVTTVILAIPLLIATIVVVTERRWTWAIAIWLLLVSLIAWFLHRWPAIEYRHRGYRLDAEGIEIRAGVIWRRVMNVPRSRVQHTDVAQGPLERRHGLGRLIVYTAGTDHARVELPGLAHQDALQIRDRLLPTTASDAV
jgi:membrane protein YdbS with pleckstrin-like domain